MGVLHVQEIKILKIPLEKIQPLYNAKVSKAYISRMKKTEKYFQEFDHLLVVEKNPNEDNYLLVGNYDTYIFLRDHTKTKSALCIVESTSNYKSVYLKVFRRIFSRGDTVFKDNKLQLLGILQQLKVSDDDIVAGSGITKGQLKKEFKYHPDIPEDMKNANTAIKTMNEIQGLPVPLEVKEFLYYHAGLQKGDPKRLTVESLSIIKSFLKGEQSINHLSSNQLIYVLKQAFNPKGTIRNKLRDVLSKILSFRKTG